jgi:hypothetical protein
MIEYIWLAPVRCVSVSMFYSKRTSMTPDLREYQRMDICLIFRKIDFTCFLHVLLFLLTITPPLHVRLRPSAQADFLQFLLAANSQCPR